MPTPPPLTLEVLRRYAVVRSLFRPTTLAGAFQRLGFVQADPIRAPARAQDLILRLRVRGYRAGDLERRYRTLPVEEDFFVNYGFVTRDLHALMHPRRATAGQSASHRGRVAALLAFVRERGTVHPRDVDNHFAHGSVTNYWGGSSNATTHLLDEMHYRGLLRVARRERGIRLYAVRDVAIAEAGVLASDRIDALIDHAVHLYAPLPQPALVWLAGRLRYAAPQWRRGIGAALRRAKSRLGHARLEGMDWYWPADDDVGRLARGGNEPAVRLLAPFDPVVWDRRRFESFWGWAYRFEAYTPSAKRRLGYYALPLLWHDQVIGWANLSVQNDALVPDVGFVARPPADPGFKSALEAEFADLSRFLNVAPARVLPIAGSAAD